ncbi:MAG: hypothetical protein MJZ92_01830 [Paludibacteraceae bacterium]|nr:hypothetical protein [Paludibacteraceae bacterium]
MKTKLILTLLICAGIPAMACAKKPKKNNPAPVAAEQQAQTPVEDEAEPVITEECIINVSLFNESVKNKQFADAYEPWWEVYSTCPNANKAIYTQGAKILEWKYENAANEAEKESIRNLIMEMYDKRIKYFGDDPRYPKAYILGQKGLDYCTFFTADELKQPAYAWLKESVEGMKEASQVSVLVKFVEVSYGLYKSNPNQYAEQFIADYSLASGFLATQAKDPTNKNATAIGQQKDYVDGLFAQSGAANCEKLDELYDKVVRENVADLDMLNKVMRLYKRVNCVESDVYFMAAEHAHKLQPTEESAVGCAKMCMKKEDWKGAISYYEQAISLENQAKEVGEDIDKADYLYTIAYINMDKLKNYMEARTMARLSLEENPNQGRCYILIGCCYASSHPYSSQDMPAAKAAIMNKTVFWAAVDQFVKAKQVDPSCTEDANKLISSYSRYFPTKEERFDLPDVFGSGTFIVGGWINERTVCR